MFSIIILMAFNLMLFARSEQAERELVRPRIYGGQEKTIEQLGGYAAQIYLGYRLVCGGGLLSARYVLSSAHCFEAAAYQKYHVIAGQTAPRNYFATESTKNLVLMLKIHPEYQKTKFVADIAVVAVSAPLWGPNVHYLPLCSAKPSVGNVATVSGWGNSEYSLQYNPLRVMEVPLISDSECNQKMERQMPDNVLCAAGYNGRTVCRGDSGGPLVINGELCGINTWTWECGNNEMPDVYMSAYFYRDFIKATMATMYTSNRTPLKMQPIPVILSLLIAPIIATTELTDKHLVKARVFSGQETSIQELGGYAVQIYKGSKMICTGSLLTKFHILTAAHCFENSDYTKFHVIAGRTNSEIFFYPNEIINFVVKLKMHPSYNKLRYIADIAVIKVKNAIRTPEVSYVPLCTRKMSAGLEATVSGWGASEFTRTKNSLRAITVPLISKAECNQKLGRKMPRNVFCAGGYNGRTICNGDSGGPLVIRGELCGVSVWTYECGNKLMPDVYMSVNFYRNFINETIAEMGD
ncbi:transmembrane protease serine 11D [Drosophila montana]|uniref:transmembrane protease serine 11D n=1 Tax=Drosophila montana TaxID=40370 RepID=UPI00313AA5C4